MWANSLSIQIAKLKMKKQAESNVGNDATVQSPPSVMETSSATDTTTELIKSLPTIVVLNVEPAGEF